MIFFTAACLLTNCSTPEQFEVTELTIVTTDTNTLSDWYASNFGFEVSNDHSLLYHDNLTIHLKESQEAQHRNAVEKAYNISYLPGLFKFGFKTNQFDELITLLRKNEVVFHSNILSDSTLNRRMVIIKDPDANLIQLFEDDGPDQLKPYFISLITEEIGEQERWFQMNLPVKKTANLDVGKNVFIRLLYSDDIAIELIQTENIRIKDELNLEEITGFYAIHLKGAPMTFETDNEGNLISNVPKN